MKEHVANTKALGQEHTWSVREMEMPGVGGHRSQRDMSLQVTEKVVSLGPGITG